MFVCPDDPNHETFMCFNPAFFDKDGEDIHESELGFVPIDPHKLGVDSQMVFCAICGEEAADIS